MKLIEKAVSLEALRLHPSGPHGRGGAGVSIEVQVDGRTYRVRVPDGARYGTKLRLGKGNDAILVKLVPPKAEAIASPEQVSEILAAEHITTELVRLLVESTRDRQELGGSCRVRPPATAEIGDVQGDPDDVWVVDGMVVTARGTKKSVRVTPMPGTTLDFHTHPGVWGGTAGLSKTDRESIIETDRPMMVIGYSVLGPDLVTVAALPLGGLGLAVSLGLKAALAVEASRRDIPARLLKLGVAARVGLPDGRFLPVRLAGGKKVRRAFEDVAFRLDRVAMNVSEQVGDLKEQIFKELTRRLMK